MTSLNKEGASKIKTWREKYPDGKVDLKSLYVHKSWKTIFKQLYADTKFANLVEKTLSDAIDKKLSPCPDLLFNAFRMTDFSKLKVVILGQDPYFNSETFEGKQVSQAMGLSFSVPHGFEIPSSLQNVYANLNKFGHLLYKPTHGNLESWAYQGCLLLNTALTVIEGKENVNCHKDVWKWATNQIIQYISENAEHVVFVLWGAMALDKSSLIDTEKHDIIVSSHPSGQSAASGLRGNPAFNDLDHFGKINASLKKWDMTPIIWQP